MHAGEKFVITGTVKKKSDGSNVDLTGETATFIITTPDEQTALMKLTEGAGITLGDGTIIIDWGTADTSQWHKYGTVRVQLFVVNDGEPLMYGDGIIVVRPNLTGLTL